MSEWPNGPWPDEVAALRAELEVAYEHNTKLVGDNHALRAELEQANSELAQHIVGSTLDGDTIRALQAEVDRAFVRGLAAEQDRILSLIHGDGALGPRLTNSRDCATVITESAFEDWIDDLTYHVKGGDPCRVCDGTGEEEYAVPGTDYETIMGECSACQQQEAILHAEDCGSGDVVRSGECDCSPERLPTIAGCDVEAIRRAGCQVHDRASEQEATDAR